MVTVYVVKKCRTFRDLLCNSAFRCRIPSSRCTVDFAVFLARTCILKALNQYEISQIFGYES